jgi:Holliday junction resolvase
MAATNGRAMKVKGSVFEREVVRVLRAAGHAFAERAYGAGRPGDVGDIDGLPGFCIEAKCHRALDLAGWVDEAVTEAANAGAGVVPVVVAKRRGKPAEDAYAVMRLTDFARLIGDEFEAAR